MADSDSGTHVTDIASASENGGQDDNDSRKEGSFRPVTETGSSSPENNQESRQEHIIQLVPSPMSSPRLTRFKNSIDPDLNEIQPSEEISRDNESPPSHTLRGPYVSSKMTSRENHVSNHHMSRSNQSRSNQSPDRSANHLTFTKGYRTLHLPGRTTRPRADAPSHVIAAHVHATPRSFRDHYSDDTMPRRHVLHRQRSLPAPRESSLGAMGPVKRAESFSDRIDGLDNLHAETQGTRDAYDFLEVNRRQYHKAKPKTTRQVDSVQDIELGIAEDEELREEQVLDDKSWVPTGIYFIFLSTLWTAVLKIVDSVGKNGPVYCAPGEQTRLWACAVALAFLQGISEALWQRKGLFKALFSMACLLSYMLISHAQPLSCLLRVDIQDISKWQAAMNCCVGALLGILVYRKVQMSVQNRKARKENRRRRRTRNQRSDDEYSFDSIPA